ncbi:MAG TPA: class I SAM-dependent methyltransferase [Ktedonobacterales bacterium]|nr:class I SAM-dependent methyltransferase [Ktedonobacterales bacterium]
MNQEHDLLAPGIPRPGGVWAVISSDAGAFTLALYGIVGPSAELYVVDKSERALGKQRRELARRAPTAHIHYVRADFTQPWELPPLDGIVLANMLHGVKLERQQEVLRHMHDALKPEEGRFILVDHEASKGSWRVPYPINYESFEYLAGVAGFADVRRLALLPVSLTREIYSALCMRAG